ncbi:MAG: hypothetical protein E7570_04890 [Ruminococcaceae bacterium]|nr:hypothetical protein [Oscillospiraceae bacterium]
MKKKISSLLLAAIMLLTCFGFAPEAFAEAPVDISSGEITLSGYEFKYTGEARTPKKVTVKITQTNPETLENETVTLVENTDFTLEFVNNLNVGTATVTATGIGNYTGILSADYSIIPCAMKASDIKITDIQKAYPNKIPAFKVAYKETALTEGVDYTVSVKNNDKVGIKTATLVVEGKGNYSGSKEKKINIYPKKVTGFTTKSRTTSSVEIQWKSQSDIGVNGYRVYTCNEKGENAKLYKTVDKNSCNVTDKKAGEYCYFYVRAIKKKDGSIISGESSKIFKTVVKPATVSLRSVTKSKDKKKLTIKWDKVGCTGYEVEYSTDKSFKKDVKKFTVKGESKTSKTVNIKSSDKTYYARVRAFRRYNKDKTTIYGKKSYKISSNYSKLYATYTTQYVNNPNRTTNLKLACKAIDGTIVYPGDTFSFNATVGQRTSAKGYKEAYVFTGPNSHAMGLGGGVCQVASTMFNAALKANFQIVERHQHAQRVTYCPLGRDAAIFWGSENFRFKNTSNYPIKIKMSCGGGSLTCSYYVCYDVSPKKVDLNVTRSGNHFTLKRKVDGKVNYTAHSTY